MRMCCSFIPGKVASPAYPFVNRGAGLGAVMEGKTPKRISVFAVPDYQIN
jgi:hypothetical protein